MLQKQTQIVVCDRSGIGWLQIFHIYRNSWRRYSFIGDFTKLAIKSMVLYPTRIRGKRYRPLRPGYVVRGFLTNTVFPVKYKDNTNINFFFNGCVLIKKKGIFRSNYIITPLLKNIRKKQYQYLFKKMI